MANYEDTLLKPKGRVLSTLEADGSRRWLYPKLAKGNYFRARRIVGYFLIAVFNVLPWIRINGNPALQFDIAARKAHVFGYTFLPTDTLLFALFMVGTILSVFFLTAIFGRVWCGWGCPQTVYMEFLIRPIERFFTGRAGVGGKPLKKVPGWRYAAMYFTFLVICFYLSNVFLAYFVGTEKLLEWMTGNPFNYFGGFFLVCFVTGLMMFDFAYWREQLCIIGCPYGRFQSVLLDRDSMIVTYDPRRGEPRGKAAVGGRQSAARTVALSVVADESSTQTADHRPQTGDCIDCTLCVQVCPTGIDIRDGLQLECINCAQCIDACNAVMDKIGRPRGLIRYSSQNIIAGARRRLIRPRVAIYSFLLIGIATVFTVLLVNKPPIDLAITRGVGQPFYVRPGGTIENILSLKLANRTNTPMTYRVSIPNHPDAQIEITDANATGALEPAKPHTASMHVLLPPSAFSGGHTDALIRVESTDGTAVAEQSVRLLGPLMPVQPEK